MVGRPKKQFCRNGHDTFIVGRYKDYRCKECVRIRVKNFRIKNPNLVLERLHSWQKSEKGIKNISERNWKRFNILNQDRLAFTYNDYNRIFQIQGGKCKICNRHQTEFRKAFAVDHDHNTGIVRGLLCDKCNRLLGYADENINNLQSAIQYLQKIKNLVKESI